MDDPHLLTAVLAALYAVLAALDGLWLHLWRYRLHRHAPREHAVHTVRALLFPGVVLLVLMGWATGPLLWLGALLAVADLAVVAWDAALETRTRTFQRGLPAGEAALHTVLQALHAVVLIVAVAIRPWSAWTLTPAPEAGPGLIATVLLVGVLGGSVVVAVVHAVLVRRGHLVVGNTGIRAEMMEAAAPPRTSRHVRMPSARRVQRRALLRRRFHG